MTTPVTTSEATSAIGFLLSLASLLGTFFYVHLSNWFRDILELKSKYELNAVGDTDQRKEGRLESRYQLRKLLNHVPFTIAVILTLFIVALTSLAMGMLSGLSPLPRALAVYKTAFSYFLTIYLILTAYFLIHGYAIALRLKSRMSTH